MSAPAMASNTPNVWGRKLLKRLVCAYAKARA